MKTRTRSYPAPVQGESARVTLDDSSERIQAKVKELRVIAAGAPAGAPLQGS